MGPQPARGQAEISACRGILTQFSLFFYDIKTGFYHIIMLIANVPLFQSMLHAMHRLHIGIYIFLKHIRNVCISMIGCFQNKTHLYHLVVLIPYMGQCCSF